MIMEFSCQEGFMKKIIIVLLTAVILLSASGCKLKQIINTVKDIAEKAKSAEEAEPIMKPPEGSPDWCGFKNADKWIKKYVMHDTSEPYYVDKLLGIVEFKGKSYGAADMEVWHGGMGGGIMRPCGTIYFNEDGSDIWIHYEIYEGYGTEIHIVDGEIVEKISLSEDIEENEDE
jgi:hypothetical protein